MIEPNMATMLVYIVTDLDCDAKVLQRALSKAVNADGSFNRISVDSDQSTSDTILVLSSQQRPRLDPALEEQAITDALSALCADLAQDVVRNGEGTQHVMKVTVTGAPTQELAHGIGKAVVNSPLVKTAIAGNDANVGRIIAAVGSYVGKYSPAWAPVVAKQCEIIVGDQTVFNNGEFTIDDKKEVKLAKILKDAELPHGTNCPKHYNTVDITIHLQGRENALKEVPCKCKGSGTCKTLQNSTVVYGSDLTHTYVDVNGGYRS
jgi:glutamate N-acetyltransferase/amino-acid N-acetyltransferase